MMSVIASLLAVPWPEWAERAKEQQAQRQKKQQDQKDKGRIRVTGVGELVGLPPTQLSAGSNFITDPETQNPPLEQTGCAQCLQHVCSHIIA
jgi:hypothetical protein